MAGCNINIHKSVVFLYTTNYQKEKLKLKFTGLDKMADDLVDMEHISLHGCIKNTSTDAAVLIKHQLISSEVHDNWKEICGSTHKSVG